MNNALKLELQLLKWNLNWRRFDARISCISRWNLLNSENEPVKGTQKMAFKISRINPNEPLKITLTISEINLYLPQKAIQGLDFKLRTASWTLKRKSWKHLENMIGGRSPASREEIVEILMIFFKHCCWWFNTGIHLSSNMRGGVITRPSLFHSYQRVFVEQKCFQKILIGPAWHPVKGCSFFKDWFMRMASLHW